MSAWTHDSMLPDASGRQQHAALASFLLPGACALLLICATAGAQQAESSAAAPRRPSGRIVDLNGQGLPDVLVQILWARGIGTGLRVNVGSAMSHRRNEGHEVARALTNAAGEYVFSLPWWFEDMKPVNSVLLATKEGYGSASVNARWLFGDELPVLALASGTVISGRIVDEFDKPVVGVRVGASFPHAEGPHACSDASGAFRIAGVMLDSEKPTLHGGGIPQNRTEADSVKGAAKQSSIWIGYGIQSLQFTRSPRDFGHWTKTPSIGEPMQVTMPRGHSKTIRILDAAGCRLRRFFVTVYNKQGRWVGTLTDDEGVVVVEGVTEEPLYIHGCGESVTVGPGRVTEACFEGVLQFQLFVVDDATGLGLCVVVLHPPGMPEHCDFLGKDWWRSGDSVAFAIGRHDVSVVVTGYAPWSGVMKVDRDTQELRLRLKKKV